MTPTTLSSDAFSWRRVWLFGSLYRREIGLAAAIYAAVIFLSYLLSIWTWKIGSLGGTLLVMSLCGWVLYFAPLMFAFAPPSRAALLPVRPVEKWTFVMLFTLLVCPLALQAFWYVPAYVCHWLFDWPTYNYLSKELVTVLASADMKYEVSPFTMWCNVMQLVAFFAVMTAGVFSAHHHPVLRGLAGLGIAFVLITLESMGWGFYAAMTGKVIPSDPDDINMVLEVMKPVFNLILASAILLTIASAWWLLHTFKKRQYD